MVLNQPFISLEFSIPVNDGLYKKLKNIDFKSLHNNGNIKESNVNEETLMVSPLYENQFKVDVLVPLSYDIGFKTCLFIHGSGSSKSSSRNKVVYLYKLLNCT